MTTLAAQHGVGRLGLRVESPLETRLRPGSTGGCWGAGVQLDTYEYTAATRLLQLLLRAFVHCWAVAVAQSLVVGSYTCQCNRDSDTDTTTLLPSSQGQGHALMSGSCGASTLEPRDSGVGNASPASVPLRERGVGSRDQVLLVDPGYPTWGLVPRRAGASCSEVRSLLLPWQVLLESLRGDSGVRIHAIRLIPC